jgi:hypothetical protein
MALWQRLYGMVWLLVFDFVVLLLYNRSPDPAVWIHIALGLGAIGLASSNLKGLEAAGAPGRLVRIARTTFRFAVAQAVLGSLMFLDIRFELGLFPAGVVGSLHIVFALAMITQASSVATAYDMWEEHEYDAPAPSVSAGPAPRAVGA